MKKSLLFLLSLSSLWLLAGCGSANSSPAPPPPTPAVATHFSVSSSTTETAGTPFNITVTALDASNNVVASYSGTLHFTSTDPQAVLPANSPLTNGTGTFSVTLKTASAETVSVSDTASAAISGTSNSINVTGPSATHFSVVTPASDTAGTSFSFTVNALDASNNVATGYSGTVHFTSTDSQAALPANSALTNGTATFSATLKTIGGQTITATDSVTASIAGTSLSVNVGGGAASHFSITAPATATAGTAFNFTVTALDASNSAVASYSGTVHFSSTDSQAILPASSTLTSGTGSFSATLKTVGSQTITATDTVTASITGTSNSISVSAAATHFSLTVPQGATAGTAFDFTVTALDASNNTVTGYSGTVHFTSTDSQAVLPANSTLTNGTRTFSATLKTAGNQTLTATDTVTASITGSSNAISVTAAAATHFSVSAPASVTAGTAFNFTVTALDASNNKVTTYSGTLHFTSTDAQAVLPANPVLTNGTANFSATLKTAGDQTITATDTVTASITGSSKSILVGVATVENPVPFINQPLSPTAVAPGGAGFTLTVNGTGFVSGSVVDWNGSARPTTFVNKSKVTAAIPASDISAASTASVAVVNPAPGGGSSNVAFFEVTKSTTWAALKPPAFLTNTSAQSGVLAQSVAVGDFNGDGNLDLAVANGSGVNNVSIFLGNGKGTFQPGTTFTAGPNASSIAVGDFNGDGKLDLAVAGFGGITVSILLGNGDGTFQSPVEYAVASNPTSVAVGDFNGDGKLDFAVGICCGNVGVSIFLGNGDGTFQPAVQTSPASARSVAVGDFNGDGKLDLAVADSGSGVDILLGNGDGTFQPAVNYLTPVGEPSSVAVADFNGDGKLDLAVTSALDIGPNLAIFLGNGDGTFQLGANFNVGLSPVSLVVADFNGDGKLDVAVVDIFGQAPLGGFTGGSVSLILGNGDGTFQTAVSENFPATSEPFSAALGDFNGDGRLDLAVTSSSGVAILLQPPVAPGPNATLFPTSLLFQCTSTNGTCGCNTFLTTTLSNFGSAALDISSIATTNGFSQTNNCGTSLQPGQSCSITVQWLQKNNFPSGTLSISDNAPGSPQTLSLDTSVQCTAALASNADPAARPAACAGK